MERFPFFVVLRVAGDKGEHEWAMSRDMSQVNAEAKPLIAYEVEPAADASNATVTVDPKYGVRIVFANGQVRYYFGVGALSATRATIQFGEIPELKQAPAPSEALVQKYGRTPRHIGVLAVGVGTINTAPGAVASIGALHVSGTTIIVGSQSR